LIAAILEFPRGPRHVRVEQRGRGEFLFEFFGSGVSLAARDGEKVPYLVEALSSLHPPDWWTCDEPLYGLAFARAYSARLEVTSVCEGKRGRIVCSRGEVVEPLGIDDVELPDGLRVHMEVDSAIFSAQSLEKGAFETVVGDVARRRGVSIDVVDDANHINGA
jgi:hypothetical protein